MALKYWCFQTVVLEKTIESPLDSKEIKSVNPKGNQPSIFIGKTDAEAEAPVLWPPDANSWLIRKDPDAEKDWRQEEKGMTEDKMVGWHHQLNGHEFEQALGNSEGQGGLACYSPWSGKELNLTEWLNNKQPSEKKVCTKGTEHFSSREDASRPSAICVSKRHFPSFLIRWSQGWKLIGKWFSFGIFFVRRLKRSPAERGGDTTGGLRWSWQHGISWFSHTSSLSSSGGIDCVSDKILKRGLLMELSEGRELFGDESGVWVRHLAPEPTLMTASCYPRVSTYGWMSCCPWWATTLSETTHRPLWHSAILI